jgi:preprotein translocase subunit SecD
MSGIYYFRTKLTLMKSHLLSFLLISILITSCADNKVRKKPPIPSSPNELVTGCYYIIEDSGSVKKTLIKDGITETYYIDPKPITTVGDFEEASVKEENGPYTLNITLNEKGKTAFATATKNYKGKRLAFIISDELVMAPTVYEEITGGALQISGNFEKKELNRFLKMIHYEMYEQ